MNMFTDQLLGVIINSLEIIIENQNILINNTSVADDGSRIPGTYPTGIESPEAIFKNQDEIPAMTEEEDG